jgi:FkbM family methyltransferase
MNSQNNEEQLILDYFKDEKGTLLSIGENDGETLSNVYRPLMLFWRGVLVEPSRYAFVRLENLWRNRKDIQLFNVAISDESGFSDFYVNDHHLSSYDTGLLSTLKKSELGRWVGTPFKKMIVETYDFKELLERSIYKKFDLISIDAEGVDYDILKQIDLKEVGCRMLIVEHNGVDTQKYVDYAAKFGMKIYSQNDCNFIFTL